MSLTITTASQLSICLINWILYSQAVNKATISLHTPRYLRNRSKNYKKETPCFWNHQRERQSALCIPALSITLLQFGFATRNIAVQSLHFAKRRSEEHLVETELRRCETVGHPWPGYCVMLWQLGRVAVTRLTLTSSSTQSQTNAVHPPNSWRNNNILGSYWIHSAEVTPLTLSVATRSV